MQSILEILSNAGKQLSTSFLQLDVLYIHIAKHIPERNLLSAQLLLFHFLGSEGDDDGLGVSIACCISEPTFRDICRRLHAVISYEPSSDPRIDLTCPFYDQGQWFHPDRLEMFMEDYVSFYDFLCNHTRCGSCINCKGTVNIYANRYGIVRS